MRCPRCKAKLPYLLSKANFDCPSCGTTLHYPLNWIVGVAVLFGGIPWLILEALLFHFNSLGTSVVLYIVSNLIVAGMTVLLFPVRVTE